MARSVTTWRGPSSDVALAFASERAQSHSSTNEKPAKNGSNIQSVSRKGRTSHVAPELQSCVSCPTE